MPYLGQSRAAGSDRVKCHGPFSFALHCMFGGLENSTFLCDARYIVRGTHMSIRRRRSHTVHTQLSYSTIGTAGQAFSPYPLGIPTRRPCMASMGVGLQHISIGETQHPSHGRRVRTREERASWLPLPCCRFMHIILGFSLFLCLSLRRSHSAPKGALLAGKGAEHVCT